MNQLRLWFDQGLSAQLSKVEFYCSASKEIRVSTRGRVTSTASTGSFNWSNGVRAISIVLVQARLAALSPCLQDACGIVGGQGSLAASLDYALSKSPAWIVDFFGTDKEGSTRSLNLFRRINPERKRPGPVHIFLNTNALDPHRIEIFINGHGTNDVEPLERLLKGLELNIPMECQGAQNTAPPLADSFISSLPLISEFSFQSLYELDGFFGKLHHQLVPSVSKTRPLVGELRHAWWPILSHGNGGRPSQDNGLPPVVYASGGKSSLDAWVGRQYIERAGRVLSRPDDGLPFDFWIYGDTVTQIFVPPETTLRIEEHFSTCSDISNFDTSAFKKNCLENQAVTKLLVVKNGTLAEELRRHVLGRTESHGEWKCA